MKKSILLLLLVIASVSAKAQTNAFTQRIEDVKYLFLRADCGGYVTNRFPNYQPSIAWNYVADNTNQIAVMMDGGVELVSYHSNLVVQLRVDGTNFSAVACESKSSVTRRTFRYLRVYQND